MTIEVGTTIHGHCWGYFGDHYEEKVCIHVGFYAKKRYVIFALDGWKETDFAIFAGDELNNLENALDIDDDWKAPEETY